RFRPWAEVLEDRTLLSASLVADINPGTGSTNPISPVLAVGPSIFFSENNGAGYELYRSDGTPAGTVQLTNVPMQRSDLANLGGAVLFFAGDGYSGYSLCGATAPLAARSRSRDHYAPG